MADPGRAAARRRWEALVALAAALGVGRDGLLRLARPCLGRFQQPEEISEEQAAWVRRQLEQAAAGKGAGR